MLKSKTFLTKSYKRMNYTELSLFHGKLNSHYEAWSYDDESREF